MTRLPEAASESLPERVGRYDIVGRLATGGMAEILLARMRGPSGFERPVVIKRILPHLVQLPGFVDMFLDEARIAAGIRHPNVVQVQELGQEERELYLVMEYVEGENISGIMRRAKARKQPLPFPLIAHVLAEAAAGLHAAHELRGPDGELLEVVHRDVSPQNIMLTYDGGVKVLDFGIAKAADRLTVTEHGIVKGKFQYMSPEAVRGAPLDRRHDVFALGIVLHELGTGMRLFHRKNELTTLEAVSRAEVVPPSQVNPAYPPELERVCLEALSLDPKDRYATVADMRRDLLGYARLALGSELPEETLAAYMQTLFPERMNEKRTMLASVRAGGDVEALPVAEVDVDVLLPDVSTVASDKVPSVSRVTPVKPAANAEAGAPEAEGEPSRWAAAGLALVAAVAAALGVLFVLVLFEVEGGRSEAVLPSEPVAEARAAVPREATPNEPAERAAAPSAEAPESAESAATAAETTEPEVAPIEEVTPSTVDVEIVTRPDGATVYVDDEARGTTPVTIELPRSETALALRIERTGYRTHSEELAPTRNQLLRIGLVREPRRGGRARGSAGTPTGGGGSSQGFRRFD